MRNWTHEHLVAYALGEMMAADRAALEGHAAADPELDARVRAQKTLAARLHDELAVAPETALTPEQRAAVFDATEAVRAERKWPIKVAAAAAVAAIAVIAVFALGPDRHALAGARLITIVTTEGGPRALIETSDGAQEWYTVGDTFRGFIVEALDPGAQAVTLLREPTGRRFALDGQGYSPIAERAAVASDSATAEESTSTTDLGIGAPMTRNSAGPDADATQIGDELQLVAIDTERTPFRATFRTRGGRVGPFREGARFGLFELKSIRTDGRACIVHWRITSEDYTFFDDGTIARSANGRMEYLAPDPTYGIESIRVIRLSPGPRVQIETGRTKRWYSEGDKFETFTLIQIDAATGCCRIYDESTDVVSEICKDDDAPSF